MELFQALKERRSVRYYEDKDIEFSKLNSMLEAATLAPTAGNAQPWSFTLVTEEQMLNNIKNFSSGIMGSPKAIVVACIDANRIYQLDSEEEGKLIAIIDLSLACQNFMLAAIEFGLGTCAIRSFNRPATSELLRLPENIEPQLLITIGYPKEQPRKPEKLPFNQVVNYEKYGVKNYG